MPKETHAKAAENDEVTMVSICKWSDDTWPEGAGIHKFPSQKEMADYISENAHNSECDCLQLQHDERACESITPSQVLSHIKEHGHYFAHPMQYFVVGEYGYAGHGEY